MQLTALTGRHQRDCFVMSGRTGAGAGRLAGREAAQNGRRWRGGRASERISRVNLGATGTTMWALGWGQLQTI